MVSSAQFELLFRGSTLGHGTFDKATGNMATLLTPASDQDYVNHLTGELGLGIIPVNQDGKCWWGAIDIDIDTIDHKDLFRRVKARNLPLNVCRSKSGGAHLFVFFIEQQSASFVQGLLRKWAGLLGFPNKTEIFPKQTKSLVDNIGNWLNLPYFSAKNTLRYAFGENGSLSFEEFITSIVFYTGKENINEKLTSDLIQIELMPPCLKTLVEEGLDKGERNNGLFNFGVFYRKSSPNDWADKLRYHDKNYVSPPVGREVESIIKSVGQRTYQYTCNSEPICSRCDRKTCITLQYGIMHRPWEDSENYSDAAFANLRKIKTDPPTFILEVNSMDVSLTSAEFQTFKTMRTKIEEKLNLVIRPMKQDQWDLKRQTLLDSRVDIEAPINASAKGAVVEFVDDFLETYDRAVSVEDLKRGTPVLEDGEVFFKVESLQKYLHSHKVVFNNQDLFAILHQRGCKFRMKTIKGKHIEAWTISVGLINRQTEHFTPEKFNKREEPEL